LLLIFVNYFLKKSSADGLVVWRVLIDPKHRVFVVGVQTDMQKDRMRPNRALMWRTRELLRRWRWPEAARPDVVFDIESQESVVRESNGNWWHRYK